MGPNFRNCTCFQYNLEDVASLAMERMKLATQQQGHPGDIFNQLLSENLSETNSDHTHEEST